MQRNRRHILLFLSTLSLRRATRCTDLVGASRDISIHALLAESDPVNTFHGDLLITFLSTLSLRRATTLTWDVAGSLDISIHALLAESDHYI